MTDTEQRLPTLVTIQQAPQIEGRDALRSEIDRLNSLLAAEEARIKQEEAEQAPPRPANEVIVLLFREIGSLLGNKEIVNHLTVELARACGL